ncbi:hypothetical protein EDD86DRAFT_212249 [Gorgonomyces haynaldii]|nr:hypothetical protein EDD86DRAFT_212249 [Gorgonomyces haynaldii]
MTRSKRKNLDSDEGLETSEDECKVRSALHLREAGKSRQFNDELEYLMDGLDCKLNVKRSTALEICQKILDAEFVNSIRPHSFLKRCFSLMIEDKDPMLDHLVLFLLYKLSKNYKDIVSIVQQEHFGSWFHRVVGQKPVFEHKGFSKYEMRFLSSVSGLFSKSQVPLDKTLLIAAIVGNLLDEHGELILLLKDHSFLNKFEECDQDLVVPFLKIIDKLTLANQLQPETSDILMPRLWTLIEDHDQAIRVLMNLVKTSDQKSVNVLMHLIERSFQEEELSRRPLLLGLLNQLIIVDENVVDMIISYSILIESREKCRSASVDQDLQRTRRPRHGMASKNRTLMLPCATWQL